MFIVVLLDANVTRVSVNLTITNAYREHTGVYACSANNSVGTDDRNASITVQCKYSVKSCALFLSLILLQFIQLLYQKSQI